MNPESSNNKLIIAVVVVSLLIFGGLVWAIVSAPSEGPLGVMNKEAVFNDADSPSIGPSDAKVVVRMYSDFQCPACRAAEPFLKAAMETYKDRVRFVWKDFPLMSIHPNARNAANAARCAQNQGKFWEYHDTLYGEQSTWSGQPNPGPSFITYAQRLGLDGDAFKVCYDSRTGDAKVGANIQEGNANGVNGTPTFYINNMPHARVLASSEWTNLLDAALAAASSTTP